MTYNLKKSYDLVGPLTPVLLDKDGNIIDGAHRKAAVPNWPEQRLDNIDSETKRLLVRIHVNWHRRGINKKEKTEDLVKLCQGNPQWDENGGYANNLAQRIGFSARHIRSYLPTEFKDQSQRKARLGKAVEECSTRRPAFKIYHKDARELKENISEPVALCVTSPPYNCRMPYKGYNDDLPWDEWDALIRDVFAQVYEVLVPGGRIAVNLPIHRNNGDFPAMRAWPILQSLGYEPIDTLVWFKAKTQEELQALMTPLTCWGSWCSPSQPYLRSAVEAIWIFQKPGAFRHSGVPDITAEEFKAWTVNIWQIPPSSNSKHSATFPKELPRRLIKLYTYPGQAVLDPFMGIGTTALAALELGRGFIGFEVSEAYVREAEAAVEAILCPAGK